MATKALTPLADRFLVFGFFETPPKDEEAFSKQWTYVQEYSTKIDGYVSGHLHLSMGPRPHFPGVDMVVFSCDDVAPLGKPDPEFERRVQVQIDEMAIRPGKYVEIGSYNDEELCYACKKRPDKTRFLITAVVADSSVSSEDLEKNWKAWMKTDFIHKRLKDKGVQDSLVYKQMNALIPLTEEIRYTVRTEVADLDEEEGPAFAKEVDQVENVAGVTTYTGYYRVCVNATCAF